MSVRVSARCDQDYAQQPVSTSTLPKSRRYTPDVVRTFVAMVLLLALLPAIVAANLTTWASRTVLDEAVFTTTVDNTLNEADLERKIADQSTSALLQIVGDSPFIYAALATQVLGLDASTPNEVVRLALTERVMALLDTPPVRAERARAVLAFHAVLTDGLDAVAPPIMVRGSELVLDLAPLIQRIVDGLDPRLTQAGLPPVPNGFAVLDIAPASTVRTVSDAATEMERDRLLAPLAVAVLAFWILLLAHRRLRAVGLMGGVSLVAGLATLAGVTAVTTTLFRTGSLSDSVTDRVVAESVGSFSTVLSDQSFVLIVGGGAVALAMGVVLAMTRR